MLFLKKYVFCLYAVMWLLRIKLLLKIFPYKKVIHTVNRWAGKQKKILQNKTFTALKVCRLIEKCAKILPLTFRCLSRALTGYIICRRYGFKVYLKMGSMQTKTNGFTAHAWLELNNQIIMGNLPNIESYFEFDMRKMNFT